MQGLASAIPSSGQAMHPTTFPSGTPQRPPHGNSTTQGSFPLRSDARPNDSWDPLVPARSPAPPLAFSATPIPHHGGRPTKVKIKTQIDTITTLATIEDLKDDTTALDWLRRYLRYMKGIQASAGDIYSFLAPVWVATCQESEAVKNERSTWSRQAQEECTNQDELERKGVPTLS